MKYEEVIMQCQFCNAQFTDQDAYQIHLGVGAPSFHACNDASEMEAKGMTRNAAGAWSISPELIVHWQGWASLKSDWKQLPPEEVNQ